MRRLLEKKNDAHDLILLLGGPCLVCGGGAGGVGGFEKYRALHGLIEPINIWVSIKYIS